MKARNGFDLNAEPLSVSESFYQRSCGYQANGRHLFYNLIHLSDHRAVLPAAYQFIKDHLALTPAQSYPSRQYLDNDESVVLWGESSRLSFSEEIDLKTCLEQVAPLLQTAPRWLDNISTAATGENEMAMGLFEISEHLNQRDGILNNQKPVMVSKAYSQNPERVSSVFDLAAVQLGLAQFPGILLPELLGFTLAYCQQPSALELLTSGLADKTGQGSGVSLPSEAAIRAGQVSALQGIINRYETDVQSQGGTAIWPRIQQGYGLYQHLTEGVVKAISERWGRPQTDEQLVENLFQKIAASAQGHHGQALLAGKKIDQWFGEQPFKSRAFMAAIRGSSYVNLKAVEHSPLLALFAFKGPMFGVLNDQEITLLKCWLAQDVKQKPVSALSRTSGKDSMSCYPQALCRPAIDFSCLSNRHFFYYLVNSEQYPEVIDSASRRVNRVLRLARCLNKAPFKSYQQGKLEQFIETIYQRGIKGYQEFKAPARLSQATYVWGIEQLAPTILVDGCWLQGVSQLQFSPYQAVGDVLQKIYSDEMGNGDVLKNHPCIYRRLLASLTIELPLVQSREFCEHRDFLNSAFDIPVFLTALSLCGNRFLPELLGVNLAIELSGLGKQYMTLRDELKYWQIDSTIVDVHISIDNVATGHTALAREAITLYLDQVQMMQGSAVMNQHWRRIYQGYCALNIASARFKAALFFQYIKKQF